MYRKIGGKKEGLFPLAHLCVGALKELGCLPALGFSKINWQLPEVHKPQLFVGKEAVKAACPQPYFLHSALIPWPLLATAQLRGDALGPRRATRIDPGDLGRLAPPRSRQHRCPPARPGCKFPGRCQPVAESLVLPLLPTPLAIFIMTAAVGKNPNKPIAAAAKDTSQHQQPSWHPNAPGQGTQGCLAGGRARGASFCGGEGCRRARLDSPTGMRRHQRDAPWDRGG